MKPNEKQTRQKQDGLPPSRPAPMLSLGVARRIAGKTLQDMCDHINAEFQFKQPVERGTLSAIENGHRGASAEMLAAIASALGISVDDIDTQYVPRRTTKRLAFTT